MWQKRIFQILLLLCGASLLLVLFLLYDYRHEKSQLEQAAKNQAQQKTQDAVQQIDEVLSKLSSVANMLASDLSAEKLPRSQIRERLEQVIEETPDLFGMGVAYIPYVNNPQTRRQSPYYLNRQGSLPIEEQDLLQLFVIPCSYSDPTIQNQIPRCVVFVEYYLNDIKTLIANLELGETGYGFILSKQGVFITHPILEYVKDSKTIFNVAENKNTKVFNRLGEKVINNESGVIEYIDDVTGQSAWIFYQPIPTTGWVLCTLVIKDEFFSKTTARQKSIEIFLWFFVFLVLLSMLLFRVEKGNIDRLWKVVFSVSILSLLGLSFILYIEQTASYREKANSTIIVDKAGGYKFLSTRIKQRLLSKEPLFYVPTGILIESMAFVDDKHVSLTGAIWQIYDESIHKNISRGFLLPDAESIKIIGAEHHRKNQQEIIKWYFESTVRQQFDYSKYPFDKREIKLRIHHKDKKKNVILIPDVDAYPKLDPNLDHPGIKHDIILPSWHIKSSFFSYQTYRYDVQLNMSKQTGARHLPYFDFTILIQRDFLTPFIGSILPFIVVVVVGGMLFAILLLLGKVGTFANVVTPLIALFFSILFAHIGLKQGTTLSEVVYVEYYYIVMYIATLAVVASYFFFHTKNNLFFIQYHNGLVPKLLFWPIILGSLLGVTVWTFYD